MSPNQQVRLPEDLGGDVLALVLEQAEQALVEVDCREDRPFFAHIGPDASDVGPLLLAVSELLDAHPGTPFELEAVTSGLREAGSASGLRRLEFHPHLLQVVRISLEIFFRRFPTLADYEAALERSGEEDGELPGPPPELWRAHRRLLISLRGTLS